MYEPTPVWWGKAPCGRGGKQERRDQGSIRRWFANKNNRGRGKTKHLGDLAVTCVASVLAAHHFNLHLTLDPMGDASPVHDDPDSPQNNAPQLGVPGMPDFFASIMRFIRARVPTVPLDPVIFQSIMLSVMAGNKHVILRAKDEDIAIVQNLAALVSNLTLVCALVGDYSLLSLGHKFVFPFPPSLSFWHELIMLIRYSATYLATRLTNTK